MRNVNRRSVAVCLLIVVLLAPSVSASDASSDAGLWAAFLAWIETHVDGAIAADDDGFVVWLMGRIGVPNG